MAHGFEQSWEDEAKLKGVAWIPLSRGLVALVDAEDAQKLNQYNWYALSHKSGVYAARRNPSGMYPKVVLMHRELMNPQGSYQVDHINHNPLDNRRSNLRLATPSENAANRRKFVDGEEKKYRGIFRHGRGWRAEIRVGKSYSYLGTFDTAYLAMLAYNAKAVELFGEFATLNDLAWAKELDGSGPEVLEESTSLT